MEMLNIMDAALVQLQVFILQAIRISAIFLTAPLLGNRNIPAIVKISIISVVISIILFYYT